MESIFISDIPRQPSANPTGLGMHLLWAADMFGKTSMTRQPNMVLSRSVVARGYVYPLYYHRIS